MLSNFLIGSAILLGFVILHVVGMFHLSALLRRRFRTEAEVNKYGGIAVGAWTIVISLAFGLFTLTDFAEPISKLGPYLSGIGVLTGIKVALTKTKPKEDQS